MVSMMSSTRCFWLILLLFQILHGVEPCADIVFVLDGSASVKEQFQQMINLASSVAIEFDVDNKGHRIAILEYSGKAVLPKWLQYDFEKFQTNDEVGKVIKKLPHIRGATDTGRALGIVLQKYLPKRRPGSPFIVFIITDGYYRDAEEVLQNVALLARQPNVQLLAATASKPYSMRGLRLLANNDSSHIAANGDTLSIARNLLKPYTGCLGLKTYAIPKKVSAPSARTKRTTANTILRTTNTPKNLRMEAKLSRNLGSGIGTLPGLATRTARSASSSGTTAINKTVLATTTTATAIAQESKKNADIKTDCLLDVVFLMDFSDGASDKRETYIDLVSTLIWAINPGKTPAQVAAVRYSGPKRTETLFHLRKHSTAEDAIKEVHRAPSSGGTTRTGEAIQYAVGEFDIKHGSRKGAKKMIVVFTDGYSQDDPTEAAQEARESGIEVKAVAVEDENVPPDTEQIIAITGDPKAFYFTKDFNKLQSLFDGYSRRCRL